MKFDFLGYSQEKNWSAMSKAEQDAIGPQAFGAEVWIARGCERLVAFLRFRAMAVLAQGVAVVGRGGPA